METSPPAPVGRDRVTPAAWRRPWVQLRMFSYHPCLFPAMLGGASQDAQAGDLVTVYDREGNVFGAGWYNPRARVPLRVLHHGEEAFGEAQLLGLLDRAVDLRLKELRLPETTDAFAYGRPMLQNGRRWEVVVVDPPKLILSREETREGERKYEDLNQLAVMVTEPGGLLVTCSCSGLLSAERFEQLTTRAAHRAGRRLQFLERTGPGADHPVMSNCPEGRYLKVLWARML